MTVLVPQCMAGQWLHDCSDALPGRAYFGPWTEESPGERRARMLLMVLAKRAVEVRVQGIGNLNR